MATLSITCPGCKAALTLPKDSLGKKGRCRSCGTMFPIEATSVNLANPVEDTVFGWLADSAGDPEPQPSATPPLVRTDRKPAAAPTPTPPEHPKNNFDIRLDHVDAMGAFFRFSPSLLLNEDFRASFPQQCVICGSELSLYVHLVIWASKLSDNAKSKLHDLKNTIIRLDHIGRPHGPDLLSRLARINYMPDPYCLPMPYYVCDGCSSVGAIMAAVHPSPQNDQDECVLGIASLPQAQAFLIANRGTDCPELKQIQDLQSDHVDHWKLMPLTLRIRLSQWYKPHTGESYLAYIPDMEYSKAEAGMAGLLLTDQRIIQRKPPKTIELPIEEHITLHFKPEGKYVMLHVHCVNGKSAAILTQDAAVHQVRAILAQHRKAAGHTSATI